MTHPTTPICAPIRDDLVAFLDAELPASRALEVERHLASCAACQGERRGLERAWSALDQLEGLPARPGWLDEVEQRIYSEPGQIVAFPTWRRRALLVAAGLL